MLLGLSCSLEQQTGTCVGSARAFGVVLGICRGVDPAPLLHSQQGWDAAAPQGSHASDAQTQQILEQLLGAGRGTLCDPQVTQHRLQNWAAVQTALA